MMTKIINNNLKLIHTITGVQNVYPKLKNSLICLIEQMISITI